jgi:Flp pilus assembly protein TadG
MPPAERKAQDVSFTARDGSVRRPFKGMAALRQWIRNERAAVAVELALLLPILATIFTAIITFGNIYQEQIAVQTGVAAAARTFAVSRGSTTPWSDAYNAFTLASGFTGTSLQSNAFYNISGTTVTTYPLYLCFVFDQCCTNDTSCLSNANSILSNYQKSIDFYNQGYNQSGYAYNSSTKSYTEYYGLSNFVFVDYPLNLVLFGVNLCPNCYVQVQSQYRTK